jgi:hypothetical protein
MSNDAFNWGLFYKSKNGVPREFREVRLVDDAVWVRSGAVKTWGTCEITQCDSVDHAHAQFHDTLVKQTTDGFVLTRQGTYDPSRFDFEQLRTEIREGARQAFAACRAAHPGETINAYALISDDSAMTIIPATNSEEAHRNKGGDEDFLWNTGEWSYQDGDEFLDIAYRLILTQCQDLPFEMEFEDFRTGFIESCVRALEDLDREGCFGAGPARESVVVLFQISDADYIDGAMRRLNTGAMYKRYRKWYNSWH